MPSARKRRSLHGKQRKVTVSSNLPPTTNSDVLERTLPLQPSKASLHGLPLLEQGLVLHAVSDLAHLLLKPFVMRGNLYDRRSPVLPLDEGKEFPTAVSSIATIIYVDHWKSNLPTGSGAVGASTPAAPSFQLPIIVPSRSYEVNRKLRKKTTNLMRVVADCGKKGIYATISDDCQTGIFTMTPRTWSRRGLQLIVQEIIAPPPSIPLLIGVGARLCVRGVINILNEICTKLKLL